MPSVVYEIYDRPQTVRVIPANASHEEEVRRYTKLVSGDQDRRSRTFMLKRPDEYESRYSKYEYDEPPYSPQMDRKIEKTEKIWRRSQSPDRGRRMERYVEIRTRRESESRASSPHPKGILRLVGSDEREERGERGEKKEKEKGKEKEKEKGKKEEKEEGKKESKKEGKREGKEGKKEEKEGKKESKKEEGKKEKKEGKEKEKKRSEQSSTRTSTTMSVVGNGATALTTTIKERTRTRSSSRSRSPSPSSSTSSKSSTKSHTRTDFSSFARTSSRTGTFYFAYNPNLSPSQMRKNLKHNPRSSKPIALAKIPNYTWYINSRGQANIASVEPAERKPAETDADIVWGLLYNLDPDDESEIDTQEGWTTIKTGGPNKNAKQTQEKPWIQGSCNTNKLFLEVEAAEWFVDPRTFGVRDINHEDDKVRALVYVDETNVKPGRIRNEYITKMREAVSEALEYGVPKGWVENVMLMYGIAARLKKKPEPKKIVDIEVEEETEVELEVETETEESEEEGEESEAESEHKSKKVNERITIVKKRRSEVY